MNSVFLFDMMFLACSEDKAMLESNLSAVAGGRPIGRGYFLAAAFSFYKYRDTPKAVNSCHSNSKWSEKTPDFVIKPSLTIRLIFGVQYNLITQSSPI